VSRRTADLAVQAVVATGTIEIDTISPTEVEITLAGPIRWRSPQPDVCVSVGKISVVDKRIDTFRSSTLEGICRIRHHLANLHRRR
jgi:hypothetical protein